MDFRCRVGGTLFIPAFLTHGLHGLTFRGEAICKLRRCTENKESPERAGASSLGMKHPLEEGETSRQPDSIPKRETRNEKRLRNAAIAFSYRHYVAAYLASRFIAPVPPNQN